MIVVGNESIMIGLRKLIEKYIKLFKCRNRIKYFNKLCEQRLRESHYAPIKRISQTQDDLDVWIDDLETLGRSWCDEVSTISVELLALHHL